MRLIIIAVALTVLPAMGCSFPHARETRRLQSSAIARSAGGSERHADDYAAASRQIEEAYQESTDDWGDVFFEFLVALIPD